MQEKKIRNSSAKTLLVMICTLSTRILGFVRIGVVNAILGDRGEADVFNIVFNIPNALRKLFAEGALSAAFIPVLSRALVEDPGGMRPKRIVRNLLTILLLILIPLTVLCVIFPGPVIRLLTDFPEVSKTDLAIALFRYFSTYILAISVAAVLMGVLNSHNIFIPSALAPLVFSICVISSVLFLYESWGLVAAAAVGIITGGLAQVLFQLPFFLKKGYDFKPDLDFRNPDFQQVLKQYLPIMAASTVAAVNNMIANNLASGLDDGSVTALSNAVVMWQFPFGIFSASITTVLFPRMSRQAAGNDLDGVRESLAHGICFIMITLIPAAVGYMLFGREIIGLALERGKFTELGTEMAGRVLFYYSPGLFSAGAYMFFQRYFYAMKDYITPLKVSLFIVFVDVLLSLWLKETQLRVAGLALANTIAFSIGLVVIALLARKRLGRINGRYILKTAGKVFFSMVLVTGSLIFYKVIMADYWTGGSTLRNGLLVAGAVTLGVALCLGLYLLTRVKIVVDIIGRRLGKK